MECESLGLRGLEEITGVSISTISRFLRGADPDMKTLKKLESFKTGKPINESKPKIIKRFKVGTKTFIVEIREEK